MENHFYGQASSGSTKTNLLTGMDQQVAKHHDEAKKECSNNGSKLLEMSSIEEERFVNSLITSERDLQTLGEQYQEMDRTWCQYRLKVLELYLTLESRIIANSLRDLGQASCLRNTCILKHNSCIPERKLFCHLLNSNRAEPDVSYAEVNFKTLSAPRVRTDRDGLNSTYSELNVRKNKPRVDKDEHSPISTRPGWRSTTAQTDEPDVSYAEVNFKSSSAPRVPKDRDGLISTYSELNVRKKKPRIDEDEDRPISSGPGGLSTTVQTAAHERESKVKIGNRLYRLICLLCLVTSALIVTVTSLLIHVSQIRQSKETCHRNYHELNSTLESTISKNSRLDLSRRTCVKNLSALNSNLSDLKGMHSDLRHQFTEMETKYKSVNETKAQICDFLTSRREQTCSGDWITNKDRCYYASTIEKSVRQAIQECSNRDSRLLEINSRDEASFVSHRVLYLTYAYWIGKCEVGNVSLALLHNVSAGPSVCIYCESYGRDRACDRGHRFICEKSAPLIPDIPEKIKDLCQQPVEST